MKAERTGPKVAEEERFRLGDVHVDLSAYTVGEDTLTEQEMLLLRALYRADGKPVSRATLYREVWGYRFEPQGRAVDFAVRRLRSKVGDDTRSPNYLLTVRGVGFKLVGVRRVGDAKPVVIQLPPPEPREHVDPLRNLRPPTSFIGRTTELEALSRLVDGSERLITLIGMGGVGKTRLAVEVLSERPAEGGLVVVELGELAPGADPASLLGQAFGLQQTPSPARLAAAVQQVGAQLLLLDRCEHLVDSLRPFLDAVIRGTELSVVATSRHRLDVVGEMLFDVPPLSEGEAAALLVARARAHRRSVRIQEGDAVVARIVQQVDGLPMALELTAARLRASSAQQVERRLRESLTSLGGGGTRSMRIALEWSWGLLPTEMREALVILSWLGPTFAPEQAEELLGPMGEVDLLIEGLVDRSWLQPSAEAPFRYRLLAPIGGWLSEQEVSPPSAIVAVFVEMCTRAVEAPDFGQLRAKAVVRGIDLAIAHQHPAALQLTCLSMWSVGAEDEPADWVARVDRIQDSLPAVSAELELRLAWTLSKTGQREMARSRLRRVLPQLTLTPSQVAQLRHLRARNLKVDGQVEAALEEALAAQAAAVEAGCTEVDVGASSLLIELWTNRGDPGAAMEMGRRAIKLIEELGQQAARSSRSVRQLRTTTQRLAPLYLMAGEVPLARELMLQNLEGLRTRGIVPRLFQALCNLALLEVMVGQIDRADMLVTEAVGLRPPLKSLFPRVQALTVQAKVAQSRGDMDAARRVARSALELTSDDEGPARLLALLMMSWIDLCEGRHTSSVLMQSNQLGRRGDMRLLGCQALGVGAWFAARRHDPSESTLELAQQAEAQASFEGLADEQVIAFAGAALGYMAAGAVGDAERAYGKAVEKAQALQHLTLSQETLGMARAELARFPAWTRS